MSSAVAPSNTASSLSGDISGGLASAVISVPACMAYGVIAVAPLGAEYVGVGIMAGFYSAVFGGLIAALFGGTPGMISGPKAPMAIVFGSVVGSLAATNPLNVEYDKIAQVSLILALSVICLGGLIQIVFGFLRFGNLIKFISYPVIAGFMNGTAVLIAKSQLWNATGIEGGSSWLDLPSKIGQIQPLTAVVTVVTILVMWNTVKVTKKINGSIVGLFAGIGVYYLFVLCGWGGNLGATIGEIPSAVPNPKYAAEFLALANSPDIGTVFAFLFVAAFSIAVLGSIDSLLTSIYCQSKTGVQPMTNRELAAQGMGNVVASVFGGIASAGSIGASGVSFQAGGRKRIAGAASSIAVLFMFLLLSHQVSLIPKAVLAGILLVISAKLFDSWSLKLFRKLADREHPGRTELWQNAAVILLVMLITIASGLIMAVGVGVGVSIVMFVVSMSKSVVRRVRDGRLTRSKRQRNATQANLLQEHGDRIRIVELDGALFFGSSDMLTNELFRMADDGARYIILDMKRVRDMDISSGRILVQNYNQLKKEMCLLSFSYLFQGGQLYQTLTEVGMFESMSEESVFADTDFALEHCEDLLLAEYPEADTVDAGVSLKNSEILSGLSEVEHGIVEAAMERREFGEDEYVFRQGDTDREAFFIVRGTASISINIDDSGRVKRLHTFGPGTVFGEMALLEGAPRSANVVAGENLVCYSLSDESFMELHAGRPEIALVVMQNLGRILANRLREANVMIHELEM